MWFSSHLERLSGANLFIYLFGLGFDCIIQSSPCNVIQFWVSKFF